ncbi:MAG TPA: MOFRL family protein, partial [Nitrolancea sp.]|nr:MOFRL family protein [Nitrolancea sp.]
GDDGTSAAAGGVVVGDTIGELAAKGLDAESYLVGNDSRRFLDASGGLIVTGQTGTNVNDLYLALIR